MTYVMAPVFGSISNDNGQWVPPTNDDITFSMWIFRNTTSIHILFSGGTLDGEFISSTLQFGTISFNYSLGPSQTYQVAWELGTQITGAWEHFVVQWNSVTATGNAWYNGALLGSPSELPGATGSMVWDGGSLAVGETDYCQGDFWLGADVGSIANFSSGGFPIDLGDDGTATGLSPTVYFSVRPGGVATDYLTNRGSAGGTFTPFNDILGFCGSPPPTPPSPNQVTMAELWFGQTSGFVDLADPGNRRRFITAAGGAQNLGGDGSSPFTVAPPVFLSRQGSDAAAEFAANRGRGGSFAVTGTALANGGSDPPGSSASITRVTPGAVSQGLLGDYRNGRLYAFNTETLLDNGSPRKWVRQWRALPNTQLKALKFNWLNVNMQTGIGAADDFVPNVMLRWSDDGGYTWSTERIMPVGAKGATTKIVKFNRLGATRRFAGTDRIFELSSTDPFAVQIFEAEVEVA